MARLCRGPRRAARAGVVPRGRTRRLRGLPGGHRLGPAGGLRPNPRTAAPGTVAASRPTSAAPSSRSGRAGCKPLVPSSAPVQDRRLEHATRPGDASRARRRPHRSASRWPRGPAVPERGASLKTRLITGTAPRGCSRHTRRSLLPTSFRTGLSARRPAGRRTRRRGAPSAARRRRTARHLARPR